MGASICLCGSVSGGVFSWKKGMVRLCLFNPSNRCNLFRSVHSALESRRKKISGSRELNIFKRKPDVLSGFLIFYGPSLHRMEVMDVPR